MQIVLYHPTANGLVERANRKILESLRHLINDEQCDWPTQKENTEKMSKKNRKRIETRIYPGMRCVIKPKSPPGLKKKQYPKFEGQYRKIKDLGIDWNLN